MQDRPAHWYSPQADPPLPAISAKRAYAEVLFVFGAFFAAGIVLAGLIVGGRNSVIRTNASWGYYSAEAVQLAFETGLAVVVVWLLAGRRGVSLKTLGLDWARDANGEIAAGRVVRNLAWATLALAIGLPITGLLQTSQLPRSHTNLAAVMVAPFVAINAGVVEELVVLAFVVVTLRQARRPWWEVTVVALVLRGSYHIYYGVGVVGILIWAALYYWTFLRTRSILPLVVCHAAWDACALISQRWTWAILIVVIGGFGLLLAGPITWLVERNNAPVAGWVPAAGAWPAQPPVAAPPAPHPAATGPGPGWHPDPSGLNQWRWWDGHQWTGYVSGHASSG